MAFDRAEAGYIDATILESDHGMSSRYLPAQGHVEACEGGEYDLGRVEGVMQLFKSLADA